jgi:DNA-binding MarR family transcriptional regulator
VTHNARNSFGRTRLLVLACVMAPSHGQPPSLREIAEKVGIHTAQVKRCLDALERDGLVTWEPDKFRTVRATCRFEKA